MSRVLTAGANTAASTGTNVQTGTSNNTKGSWVQLVASTDVDTSWLGLSFGNFENIAGIDYLFDIGVGAAASETAIVNNICLSARGTWIPTSPPLFPVSIPSGSRIAARAQCSNSGVSGRATKLAAHLFGGGSAQSSPHGLVTTMGANTADSGGVNVDPGAVAHTKGAWSELSSSVPFSTRWLVVAIGNQINGGRSLANWLVDLGTGAGGSETVVVPDVCIQCIASGTIIPQLISLPLSLPAGERLAVRAQCDITDATDRTFDAIAYGVS